MKYGKTRGVIKRQKEMRKIKVGEYLRKQ